MRKHITRLGAFVLGLLAILVILEIGLRVFASSFEYTYSETDYQLKEKNTFTILCLGDSHTFGFGAEHGHSYPSRLRQLLRAKSKKKFNVINKGLLAQNTAQLLNILPDQIDKYNADLIILMTGGANHWNYYGYRSAAEDFLYEIRIFRLIKLLISDIKDKSNESEQNLIYTQDEIDNLTNKLKKYPDDPKIYFHIGYMHTRNMKLREAIKWYKAGIDVDHKYLNNYVMANLSYITLNEVDSAIAWLHQELEKHPGNEALYNMLGIDYLALGNNDEAKKWCQKAKDTGELVESGINAIKTNDLNELEQRAAEVNNMYARFMQSPTRFALGFYERNMVQSGEPLIDKNMAEVSEWIRGDLIKILRTCNEKKVPVIMQSYAVKPVNNTHRKVNISVNRIMREIASQYNVPFVDNEVLFNDLGMKQKQYFLVPINDAHPNEKGYALMATNVFEMIERLGLL